MTRARAAAGSPGAASRGVGAAAGWTLAAAVPLAFLGLFFAWPVVTMIGRGFAPDGSWDLSAFGEVFGAPRTWRIIGLTLAQSVLGTGFAVVLGVPGAYVLYRCRWRGQRVARAIVAVPFVLPTVVVGVAFRSLLIEGGPLGFLHLDQTFAAIVLALVFFNYSVVVRTVGGLWERLDPRAEQAARALGASPWRALRTVTLPALAPAIASAAAVVFLFCATAFGVVLILGGIRFGTVETEIWVQTTQFLDLPAAAVLSIVQLAVITCALVVAGRARTRREVALALAPAEAATHRLRLVRHTAAGPRPGADLVPALIAGATVVALIATPLAALVVRSLRTGSGWGLGNYTNLATTGSDGVLTVTVWQAAGNSLRAALIAAALAVVIGSLVALLVSRRPRRRRARRAVALLDSVFMLPLGVSAVTVGFGFLITLDRPILGVDPRTSGVLVPIAQAVVAIPLVVRCIAPALRAVDPRLREAAATLGASPARVLLTVDAPAAARAFGLAVGFALAVALGEFGATSFVARPDNATLPVVIFRLIGRPGADNYGMALAASVILAAVTAVVMLAAERLRGDSAAGEW